MRDVPPGLRSGPFTVAEAHALGVTRGQLSGLAYRRLGAGLYRWAGRAEGTDLMLAAIAKRLPPGAAFSGTTATWLHGLDPKLCQPIEVTVPDASSTSQRAGVRVRRAALAPCEVVVRKGLPTTSAMRTVADLGGRDPLTEGVVVADLFLHARRVTTAELKGYVEAHGGSKGVGRLRRVLELAEPKAESAMETRLRLLVVFDGLPRPEAQFHIRDAFGRSIARVDLAYPRERIAIEYDGDNHNDRLPEDNRRQNRILEAGYQLLRFTASDVYGAPERVVDQVRRALARNHLD